VCYFANIPSISCIGIICATSLLRWLMV
jgi:hypothetical protein